MTDLLKKYLESLIDAWNRFWFQSRRPETLCLMRILVGTMLVYTHSVWTAELPTFFSADGVFPGEYQESFTGGSPFVWSHFNLSDSPTWMWGTHFVALATLLAFTVGLWTRWTGILSFLIVVSYANRAGGALFGLDQINGFLTLYLAIGPSGLCYSLDAWRKSKNGKNSSGTNKNLHEALAGQGGGALETTMANVSTRLIQLHLCVVYLFAGLGKLQGVSWWDGTAIWGALASYEYQTMDMTWMVHLPWLINIVTLVSVFWELSYPFMIWNKLARPIYLLLAAAVHLGIGMAMGMMTFGVIMLIANMAFLSPESIQSIQQRFSKPKQQGG